MVKVVVPVADETGTTVSEHFGKAPFFAFFDINDGKVGEWKVRPNKSEHMGGKGHPIAAHHATRRRGGHQHGDG